MSQPPLSDHVAKRIRELREAFGTRGISQEDLAKRVGTTGNTISRWETGTYRPTIDDIERLSRALNVSILEFFPADDAEEPEALSALRRTARFLDQTDLEELRSYAEYRKARHLLKAKPTPRGRRPASG